MCLPCQSNSTTETDPVLELSGAELIAALDKEGQHVSASSATMADLQELYSAIVDNKRNAMGNLENL